MYTIEAIIGDKKIIKELKERFQETTTEVIINDELSMLPVTIDAFNWINKDDEDIFLVNGFSKLSVKMYSVLSSFSNIGKIGYMEAEYFGGQGSQCAIAFNNTKEEFQEIQNDKSINKLLKFLGIKAEKGKDEFDTIELGKFRNTEKWIINK